MSSSPRIGKHHAATRGDSAPVSTGPNIPSNTMPWDIYRSMNFVDFCMGSMSRWIYRLFSPKYAVPGYFLKKHFVPLPPGIWRSQRFESPNVPPPGQDAQGPTILRFKAPSSPWLVWSPVMTEWLDGWNILLMAEILHQLIGSLSHYLQGFSHLRWCRISSINSTMHGLFWTAWWFTHSTTPFFSPPWERIFCSSFRTIGCFSTVQSLEKKDLCWRIALPKKLRR